MRLSWKGLGDEEIERRKCEKQEEKKTCGCERERERALGKSGLILVSMR